MAKKQKKKRNSYARDMMELTAFPVAGTASVLAINSLPSTGVPAVEASKNFVGTGIGLMATMKGGGMLLKSVKDLEKMGGK